MHLLSALLLCAACTSTLASKPQHQPRHPAPAVPRTHSNVALRLRGPANTTAQVTRAWEKGTEMGKRLHGRGDDVIPDEYGSRRVYGRIVIGSFAFPSC
ncbi:hypothetical protein DFH06DRAFT_1293756 [Mycena polygramma]|nr:hypothetical protein DFH06DRAFT_1293756 [Mycena polygramma]